MHPRADLWNTITMRCIGLEQVSRLWEGLWRVGVSHFVSLWHTVTWHRISDFTGSFLKVFFVHCLPVTKMTKRTRRTMRTKEKTKKFLPPQVAKFWYFGSWGGRLGWLGSFTELPVIQWSVVGAQEREIGNYRCDIVTCYVVMQWCDSDVEVMSHNLISNIVFT